MSAVGGMLGAETLRSMSDDIESLCLVRDCRELEETFGTHYDEILCDGDACRKLRGRCTKGTRR